MYNYKFKRWYMQLWSMHFVQKSILSEFTVFMNVCKYKAQIKQFDAVLQHDAFLN